MKEYYVLVIMLIIGFSVEAQQNVLPNIEISSDSIPDWFNDLRPEDKIWGIGVGKLSTENASCELAKFNAQVEICRSISLYYIRVETELDDALSSEQDLLDKLYLYRNEFYNSISLMASEQVAFELSEFVKTERRTKTKDGSIWYLVSIQKNVANNFEKTINNYEKDYIESYTKDLDDFFEKIKMMDEALEELK